MDWEEAREEEEDDCAEPDDDDDDTWEGFLKTCSPSDILLIDSIANLKRRSNSNEESFGSWLEMQALYPRHINT